MNILLKQITILSPGQPHHGRTADVLVRRGKIADIGAIPDTGECPVWKYEGACLSPGWIDIGALAGDPGLEHREDLRTLAQAAIAGGFTSVALRPNTQPALHSKSEIEYIKSQSAGIPVELLPMGALTLDCAGNEMAEMMDMKAAGAVAFTDGLHALRHNGMMLRCLQYCHSTGAMMLHFPFDVSLAVDGQMHEGAVSTSLGLPGIPALSEEIIVQRDLHIAAYSGAPLHLLSITTAGSVELIRRAKNSGLPITCSVPAAHLLLEDALLKEFDTRYKILPPLRTASDIKALKKGLKDGTIDFITSDHTPLDTEAKDLEFSYAAFGITGLETAFATARTALLQTLEPGELIQKLAVHPRKILGLPVPEVEIGAEARLTLFHPNEKWVFGEGDIRSKSRNTPFVGTPFTGKVLGVICGNYCSLPVQD